MKIIIKSDEKTETLEVDESAKTGISTINNSSYVFQESFITVEGVSFNLHLFINGLKNTVYDINDVSENYIQANAGPYVVLAPVFVSNGVLKIKENKFSINDGSKRKSLMDNFDFSHSFDDVKKILEKQAFK